MSESSRRNLWKRNRRSTCERGNSKLLRNIKQNTKKRYKKDTRKESIRKWHSQWEETTKGAITREFFPSVERRLAVNLNLSPNVTTIMTGHENIRSYLHRLKITVSPECPCKHGIQTVDHLILQWKRLKNEREILKSSVLKVGKCPVSKSELTNGNLQQFIRYINSMDIKKINHLTNRCKWTTATEM